MLYYAYGTALLTNDEVRELGAKEKAKELVDNIAGRKAGARSIDLVNGMLSPEMLATDQGPSTDWQSIGPGKPLTIDIREVYTSNHPGGGIFGGPHSMLVTSAVKSIATYDAKPRAINFLTRETNTNSRLSRPKASEEGTPVIFYSPAIVDLSLTVDVGLVFDEFPQPVFDAVGNAFKSAAGLPVFMPYSGYLLAASQIARIIGATGEALFDGKPVLDASESINLELPGTVRTVAGYMLIMPTNIDKLDPTFRERHHVSNGTLVNKAGKPYNGDIPYVILSVDGTPRDDLAKFAPTAISTAVLSRFFGIKEGQSLSLDPLLDALRLYNDFTFRSQLDEIDKRLNGLPEGPEKNALKLKREAVLKNIVTDQLKPEPAA